MRKAADAILNVYKPESTTDLVVRNRDSRGYLSAIALLFPWGQPPVELWVKTVSLHLVARSW